jgi:topoisomerase (DNA) II binding protein 1
MYRPLKDLDGIPGAKDLIVCLTGYLRQDREDIMVSICYTLSYWFWPGAYIHCYVTILDLTILSLFRQWLAWWVHNFLNRWWQTRLPILYATNLKVWFIFVIGIYNREQVGILSMSQKKWSTICVRERERHTKEFGKFHV